MASGVNQVLLVGNLGRDAELSEHQTGAMMRLNLATTERVWDGTASRYENRTEWHRVTLWGNRASALAPLLKKGQRVVVTGKLVTRDWTDREGKKRTTTEIKALDLQFAGPRPGSEPRSTSAPAPEHEDRTAPELRQVPGVGAVAANQQHARVAAE